MSQRQLIDEIRFLLDSTCPSCDHSRCAANIVTLRTLVADNPTSTFSTKVMYNIGVRRYERLTRALAPAQATREAPLPIRYEALVRDSLDS